MNGSGDARTYNKPNLRNLGRMDRVQMKTKPKPGFKNDPSTHDLTRDKPS